MAGKPGARLASGAQLWRLNQLGILSEALNAEEPVSADRARELLSEAASRGLWAPPRSDLPSARSGSPPTKQLPAGEPAAPEQAPRQSTPPRGRAGGCRARSTRGSDSWRRNPVANPQAPDSR